MPGAMRAAPAPRSRLINHAAEKCKPDCALALEAQQKGFKPVCNAIIPLNLSSRIELLAWQNSGKKPKT